MKTILFLIPSFHARGAERALVNLVNNLDKCKYEITVQALFDVGPLRGELLEGVTYRGGLPFLLRGYVSLQKLFSPTSLYKSIIRRRYDIVVAYLEGTVTRIVSGCPFQDSRKIAWVHIEQEDISSFAYCYRSFEEAKQCYQSIHQIVSVSNSVSNSLSRISGLPSVVIHNIVEKEKIRQLSLESIQDFKFSASLNFVSVGALTEQKGYDRLIRIHKRLIDAGYLHHIYVFGEGEERQALEQLIRSQEISETFHLSGYQKNPYKYVAKADCFVCSSRQEGLSTAITEALLLEIPVISTDCGGARELLGEHGENGLITPNTEQGLYDGMLQLLVRPDLLKHYSQMAAAFSFAFSNNMILTNHDQLFLSTES